MARDDSGAGTVVVAFVLGAITGAAVALLMAPATGEETRRMLAEKAREGREKAGDAARQGRELWNRQRETLGPRFRARTRGLRAGAQRAASDPSRGGRVNDWSQAFLGVIAVSTALMAVMQIGAIRRPRRVATQVRDIVATLQKDIRPLIGRANEIAEEASKTADHRHRAGRENRQARDRSDPTRGRDVRRRAAGDHYACA